MGVVACNRLMKVASEGAVNIRDSLQRGISRCECCRYPRPYWRHPRMVAAPMVFFFLVSRTRHHSCAGHCFTKRSYCNFIRNATIPPGRNKKQRETTQKATKQNKQHKTNQTQTTNQTPEWKQSSLCLYNIQLK